MQRFTIAFALLALTLTYGCSDRDCWPSDPELAPPQLVFTYGTDTKFSGGEQPSVNTANINGSNWSVPAHNAMMLSQPQNGRMALVTGDGIERIQVADVDGTNRVTIDEFPPNGPRRAGYFFAVLSPDASKISYIVYENGTTNLTVANTDGTGKVVIDRNIGPAGVAFSPDSRRLAYYVWTDQVRIADVTGATPPVTVANDSYGWSDNAYLSWSPSGDKLLYAGLHWSPMKHCEVHLLDLNTNTARSLGFGGHASFSPDGSKIAFWGGYYSVGVMNADGSDKYYLREQFEDFNRFSDREFYPHWSPDGKHIACTTLPNNWTRNLDLDPGSFRVYDVAAKKALPPPQSGMLPEIRSGQRGIFMVYWTN